MNGGGRANVPEDLERPVWRGVSGPESGSKGGKGGGNLTGPKKGTTTISRSGGREAGVRRKKWSKA